jgi:hypothetical protein
MIRSMKYFSVLATAIAFAGADAQTPAADPSDRLREVLPADVAERVLAKIAEARSRELPAAALENRALKFAAKGVAPADIERSVTEHAQRMEQAKSAIERGRGGRAQGEEVDAGAEAMRRGVDGAAVSELAKSAPSGRSLAVPLMVIGSLVERGLPSDDALLRVQERLQARATDAELEELPRDLAAGRPSTTGQDLARTKRPASAGRPTTTPPVAVPQNPGTGTSGKRPDVVPPTKRP